MLNLFRKKAVDEKKAAEFVSWFFRNEGRIRTSVEKREEDRNTMLSVLDEAESQLAAVYRDGYQGEIEFDYGGKDDSWELRLYHKNDHFLMEASACIAAMFEERNDPVWTIRISR